MDRLFLNKKSKQNKSIRMVSFDARLINCLRTKTNHQFSPFDAFMWLIENIPSSNEKADDDSRPCDKAELRVSYTRLGDIWNWSRQTVQKFLTDLERSDVITKQKDGNLFVVTFTDSSNQHLVAKYRDTFG